MPELNSAALSYTRVRDGSRPVMNEARAGEHSGLAAYAASKMTPEEASHDIAGAFVTAFPWNGRADGVSWSAMMSRMFGRAPDGIAVTSQGPAGWGAAGGS